MYVLTFKGRNYTCPDSSLLAFAQIQAMDRDDISWVKTDEEAKTYLESLGFAIGHTKDEPLTEIPQYADFNNSQQRNLYYELEKKPDSEKTEAERRFCISMYHAEEASCGLL